MFNPSTAAPRGRLGNERPGKEDLVKQARAESVQADALGGQRELANTTVRNCYECVEGRSS